MKYTPVAIIAFSALALVALLGLPWVASGGASITLLDVISAKAHGYQVAYFILAPLALAVVVGAVSLKQSRRWMTGVLAFVLIIPVLLSAVAKHAALGAHLCTAASAIALVCAIVLTVKPVRVEAV